MVEDIEIPDFGFRRRFPRRRGEFSRGGYSVTLTFVYFHVSYEYFIRARVKCEMIGEVISRSIVLSIRPI